MTRSGMAGGVGGVGGRTCMLGSDLGNGDRGAAQRCLLCMLLLLLQSPPNVLVCNMHSSAALVS